MIRAAVRRPRGLLLPQGAGPAGCTPHFLFPLVEKKTGRARSKRKDRFWSQLCTCVQSCCTGVGVRWCLRVCDDKTTGAAGYGAGLVVDSRGVVCLRSGCRDAFDQLLFPRVPLRYALPRALVGADALIGPLHQLPRGTASGSEKRSSSMRRPPRRRSTIRHGTTVPEIAEDDSAPEGRPKSALAPIRRPPSRRGANAPERV